MNVDRKCKLPIGAAIALLYPRGKNVKRDIYWTSSDILENSYTIALQRAGRVAKFTCSSPLREIYSPYNSDEFSSVLKDADYYT